MPLIKPTSNVPFVRRHSTSTEVMSDTTAICNDAVIKMYTVFDARRKWIVHNLAQLLPDYPYWVF